jgi:predicted TPR repeat methyltransferase/Flp pilus assembly protein TadD
MHASVETIWRKEALAALTGADDSALPALWQARPSQPSAATILDGFLPLLAWRMGQRCLAEEMARYATEQFPESAAAFNNLGEILRMSGRPVDAVAELEHAVLLEPEYWQARQNLAFAYVAAGQTGQARMQWTCICGAVNGCGEQTDLLQMAGELALDLDANREAALIGQRLTTMRPTIAAGWLIMVRAAERLAQCLQSRFLSRTASCPDEPVLLNRLTATMLGGSLRRWAGPLLERSLSIDSSDCETHNNAGVAAACDRDYARAERHFRTASDGAATREVALLNLARLLIGIGRESEAEALLGDRADAPHPSGDWLLIAAELMNNCRRFAKAARFARLGLRLDARRPGVWAAQLALANAGGGRPARALRWAERAVGSAPRDPLHWELLGHCRSGCRDSRGAEAARTRALRLRDRTRDQAYFLCAYRGRRVPPRSPRDYVRRLFDGYAPKYDGHLRGGLRFMLPEHVRDAVVSTGPIGRGVGRVLDLGCGTGLLGGLLREHASTMTGVDLSERMLGLARERGCYDELACEEIVEFVGRTRDSWDTITACDVLVYFGDLSEFAQACAAALVVGGRLVFSVEKGEGSGYRLAPSGRFVHGVDCVRATLTGAGLRPLAIREVDGRFEGGVPVSCLVVTATRDGDYP